MTTEQMVLLADVILVVHFLIAAFNAFSLPVIWLGGLLKWGFVHNPWFRFIHVGLMAFVALQAVGGKLCPLTIWEAALREATGTGGVGQGQSFIAYWAGRILFQDFEPHVFAISYSLFTLAIVATFVMVPVRFKRRKREKNA